MSIGLRAIKLMVEIMQLFIFLYGKTTNQCAFKICVSIKEKYVVNIIYIKRMFFCFFNPPPMRSRASFGKWHYQSCLENLTKKMWRAEVALTHCGSCLWRRMAIKRIQVLVGQADMVGEMKQQNPQGALHIIDFPTHIKTETGRKGALIKPILETLLREIHCLVILLGVRQTAVYWFKWEAVLISWHCLINTEQSHSTSLK